MANYVKLAVLCLMMLSSAKIASGKIRGNYYARARTLGALSSHRVSHRQLMGNEKKGQKLDGNGERKQTGAKGGQEKGKGDKAAGSDDDVVTTELSIAGTIGPTENSAPFEDSKIVTPESLDKVKVGSKGNKAGIQHKGGKEKGVKQKNGKGTKASRSEGSDKYADSDKDGKTKSDTKSDEKYAGNSNKKGGKSQYKSSKAVEKKQKSQVDKAHDKSKYKLAKSVEGYDDESTFHPSTGELEPTLVEVPLSFYFSFEEKEERRTLEGHTVYEPTPMEMETFKAAAMEYAVRLFDYLHESNPETFHSVTSTIDKVTINPGAAYPLQVDVTFYVLYNEAPENAPTPEEVGDILGQAFTTDEFIYFYLWEHDDMWNNVSIVKVEPNFDESESYVWATMVYDFGIDPTSEPTDADYDLLVSLTEDFFSDLLTDYYKEDANTTFKELLAQRHATTFDLEATPPAILDYSFKVEFEEDGKTTSSDELFKIMAEANFEDYIRIHLEPSESIWSTVNRVSLLEYSSPEGPGSPNASDGSEGGLVPSASADKVKATMLHSFFVGMATMPTEEDFAKLEMATNFFFMETLTTAFGNNTEFSSFTSSTEIDSNNYNESAKEPLQVDYSISYMVEGTPVEPSVVFTTLENADYDIYIMDYLWKEGDPWTSVNGVMLVPGSDSP